MIHARAFALVMLNGSLDDEFVVPFLDGLCASGYRGVCLHPRDGLRVPYNSRFYWERISHLISLARARDLEVCHYDEFPFPSGSAGGLMPALWPESRMRELDFSFVDETLGADNLISLGPQPLLALVRFREENQVWRDAQDVTPDTGPHLDTWVWGHWHNRFYTGTHHVREERHERAVADRFNLVYRPETPIEPGERLLAVRLQTVAGQKGQSGKPDLTRPDVSEAFLKLIYTRFSELSTKHNLENTPVFQDEVTFGTEFPWNGEIERRLSAVWGERETHGDNWARGFLAMWAPRIDEWETARFSYRRAAGEALEAGWFARAQKFCAQNNLRVMGHLPGEESIFAHSQLMGDAFKTLRHFDVPGYDIISGHIPDENSSQSLGAKLVQSAAWLDGKPSMAEAFAANGFHADLASNRSVLGWLGAHDFTHVFDHSTYLSALGVRKYDAPPVNNRFNPLDVGRADLWRWHDWLCDQLEEFRFHPRTLVVFPAESLARYRWSEGELWRDETELLESWFSFLCAQSLDVLWVPSHRLADVEPVEQGFQLREHVFQTLLVPPLHSFHEEVWAQLNRFVDEAGFHWFAPDDARSVAVFGGAKGSEARPIPAQHRVSCRAGERLSSGAAWFAPFVDARVQSAHTLLQSVRQNASGDEMLLLLNPHEFAVEANLSGDWSALPQPPNAQAAFVDEERITLAPRDVQLLKRARAEANSPRIEVRAREVELRWSAPNVLSLSSGTAHLEGFDSRPFSPVAISSLWPLSTPISPSEAVWAPPYSAADLPSPLEFQVSFPIELAQSLTELSVVWDAESLPPGARAWWNNTQLQPVLRDVFDHNNTVWPVPASLLVAGTHGLTLQATSTNAAQGVLERPIVRGAFSAFVDETHAPVLRAIPTDWMPFTLKSWPELGAPEMFGPVEYRMQFFVDEAPSRGAWELSVPPFVGVAEVFVDERFAGKTSWEPRVVPIGSLTKGNHHVFLRVWGSWNNVFSALNRVSNGLNEAPVLRFRAR